MTAYPFQDRIREHDRLVAQGAVFDPLTRRLFQEAGLAPGMRVLDLGSGAGNVARLAAEFVTSSGEVLGIDADPRAVELASQMSQSPNLAFKLGNVATLDLVDGPFDAVVGRLVLMYVPDPVAALRRIAEKVRPGGLICLHECDLAYVYVGGGEMPLWERARGWFLDALVKAGVESRMGPALFTTFRAAGLPPPELLVEAFAQGGPDAPAWAWANVISGAAPLMERFGVATKADLDAELDAATLADRMLGEVLAVDGCVIGPPMTGAWTRLPHA